MFLGEKNNLLKYFFVKTRRVSRRHLSDSEGEDNAAARVEILIKKEHVEDGVLDAVSSEEEEEEEALPPKTRPSTKAKAACKTNKTKKTPVSNQAENKKSRADSHAANKDVSQRIQYIFCNLYIQDRLQSVP